MFATFSIIALHGPAKAGHYALHLSLFTFYFLLSTFF
jgi:hypothetical protein